MNGRLIIPKKPWWERLSQSLSPQVKAAIITAGVMIALSIISLVGTLNENSRLKREATSKTARIQELELELTPFRTLAVATYSKADADALRRLAETMTALQRDYAEALNTVTSLQRQLASLQTKMAPRSLAPEQQRSLQDRLEAFSGQQFAILTYQDDPETLDLANTIYRVLLSSGWVYVRTNEFLGFGLTVGVVIEIAPSHIAAFKGPGDALASALTTERITASVKVSPEQETTHPNILNIKVGKKP